MSEQRSAYARYAAAALIVALAVTLHAVARRMETPQVSVLLNFVRTFLYLGLFAAWGVSAARRVMQAQVRRYLIAVAVLVLFWLTVREFKFRFVLQPDALRLMWYAYYIPILLIPLLALFVSLSLDRSEDYRMPRATALLYLPTVALIALVLTNDLHGLVFAFRGVRSEYADYSYGPLFFCVIAWCAALALASFAVMVFKARFTWAPLVPFAAALAYVALYALRSPLVAELDDLAVLFCLLYVAFFECCIACGLIRSNTRYSELFRAFTGASIQITDENYDVRYSAADAVKIPLETMREAERAPVLTADGERINNMPLRGGHVVWAEDVRELARKSAELRDIRETLTERNEFLQYSYERDKESKTVAEQNRLYDLLDSRTVRQINEINRLARAYGGASPDEGRRILARIVVLGSYVKRCRDFVLSLDSSPDLPDGALEGAFSESLSALERCGMSGGRLVRSDSGRIEGEKVLTAYDFFEDAAEAVMEKAKHLSVRVSGGIQVSVLTDCADGADALSARYPNMTARTDEDGAEYTLVLE